MAYTTTPNLALQKPVIGTNQPFETSVINSNWDKVDSIYEVVIDIQADGQAQIDTFDALADTALSQFEASSSSALSTFDTESDAAIAALNTTAIINAINANALDINGGTA